MPGSVFGLWQVEETLEYIARWRRKQANLPEPDFKAWHVVILFNVLIQLYLVIMPWYPPAGGQYAGDVSFWYATSPATGVGILIACGIYYWFWAFLIPKWRGYKLRQEVITLDGGAQSNQLRKDPIARIAGWDVTHDVAGIAIEPEAEQIQVQGKVTQTSSNDSRSYAYTAKNDSDAIPHV